MKKKLDIKIKYIYYSLIIIFFCMEKRGPRVANPTQDSLLNIENLHGLLTFCNLRLSFLRSYCQKMCMRPVKRSVWPGEWAVCCETASEENEGSKNPKWISCRQLETLTSQFVLDCHNSLLLYNCILNIYNINQTTPSISLHLILKSNRFPFGDTMQGDHPSCSPSLLWATLSWWKVWVR